MSEEKTMGLIAGNGIFSVVRQLAVDLWRLFTGQTTAENLGLIYLPEAA